MSVDTKLLSCVWRTKLFVKFAFVSSSTHSPFEGCNDWVVTLIPYSKLVLAYSEDRS